MDATVVVAINFGSNYSRYAYSFRQDYVRDPLRIFSSRWVTETRSTESTSSTLLLTPEKKFHSFGYEAEEKFASLVETGDYKNWFYFRRFKMILQNKNLKLDTMIKDQNGHEMPALTIFSMAINYLRSHVIKQFNPGFEEDDITWVLTVPAVLDDSAMQFMRKSSQMAGIKAQQLLWALEPETALIYCKELPMRLFERKKTGSMMSLCPGTRYLVLNIGGETMDWTVHEINQNGTLCEIYKSTTDGAAVETKVDEAFNKFLIKLLGNDVLTKFKRRYRGDYINLIQDFERKKRKMRPDMDDLISFRIPKVLESLFFEYNDETLKQVLPQTTYEIKLTRDKLQMNCNIFKDFFSEAITDCITYTRQIFQTCKEDIENVFLVGGFSDSEMVFNALRENFPDKEICRPQNCGLAVLLGAVLFGYNPHVICSRVCRFTYGHEVFEPFVPGLHPEAYKVNRPDGRVMCGKIFRKYVEIGSQIPVGLQICRSFKPSDEDATTGIALYKSTSKNPEFITDSSCTFLGSIVIKKPIGGWTKKAKIYLSMEFGSSEFYVYIKDDCSQETYSASYSFLE